MTQRLQEANAVRNTGKTRCAGPPRTFPHDDENALSPAGKRAFSVTDIASYQRERI